jgi:hypothetical protein
MSNWYYLVNGQQEGPVSQDELLKKFTGGQLATDTFIWSKGMKDWLKANEVEGLLTQGGAQASAAPAAAEQAPVSEEASAAAALAAALADDEPAAEAPAAEPQAPAGKLSLAKREEPAEQPQQSAPTAEGGPAAPVIGQPDFSPPTQAEAAYLYISPFRLIFMSILSAGVYEIYWIYKNWKYAKMRDGLNIMPFWRGWFGIFHCHSLMRFIHMDKVLNRWEEPKFKPNTLATIWVIMILLSNGAGQAETAIASILSVLWPSFLCFVPVQMYINRVNKQMAPNAKKTGFTLGHIVVTLFGLLVWGLLILMMVLPEEVLTQ